MAVFSDLPDESIVYILVLSGPQVIARFQRVCQRLHALVASSLPLIYILSIDSLGYTLPFVSRPDLALAENIELLRRHRLRWTQLETLKPIRYPLKLDTPWSDTYVGGVYVQQTVMADYSGYFQELHFYQLPSSNLGLKYKQWTLGNLGPCLHSYMIDPEQDLLVLFETSDYQSSQLMQKNRFTIHLRTMGDNQPHPKATTSSVVLEFEYNVLGDGGVETALLLPTIQVSGALVVYMVSLSRGVLDPAAHGFYIIFNWRRGVEVTRMPFGPHQNFSFSLLSQRKILLPNDNSVGSMELRQPGLQRPYGVPNHACGSLDLYAFDPDSESSHPARLLSSFLLPKSDKSTGSNTTVRISAITTQTDPRDMRVRPKAYEPFPREPAIYIDVHTKFGSEGRQREYSLGVLRIPLAVFLDQHHHPSYLPLEPTQIPWLAWAHRTTWIDTDLFERRHGQGLHSHEISYGHILAGRWRASVDLETLAAYDILLIDLNQTRLSRKLSLTPETGSESSWAYVPKSTNLNGRKNYGVEVFCATDMPVKTDYTGVFVPVDQSALSPGRLDEIIVDDEHGKWYIAQCGT